MCSFVSDLWPVTDETRADVLRGPTGWCVNFRSLAGEISPTPLPRRVEVYGRR